jgi:periplasmic protein TonB
MAYADRERVKPAGLAAATLINGAVLAALLLAAPQIIDAGEIFTTTIAEEITLEPPKPIEPDTKRVPPPVIPQTQIARVDPRPVPVPPLPPYVEPVIDKPALVLPPYVEPVAPIKPVHVPLLKGSRIDPRYASKLQPDYPPSLARGGIEGSVTVRVRVGADGRVSEIQILRSDDEEFSRVTRETALKKWRFLPATSDGEPVESWREMNVRFLIPT